MSHKRCIYCHRWFLPDPRTLRYHPESDKPYSTQKACQRPECRRGRKRHADRNWRERNRSWFKDRQSKVRDWSREYPDYWKRYRAAHPDYQTRERKRMRKKRVLSVAKQDAIGRNPVGYLKDIRNLAGESVAKQDAFGLQIDGIVDYLMVGVRVAKPNATDFMGIG